MSNVLSVPPAAPAHLAAWLCFQADVSDVPPVQISTGLTQRPVDDLTAPWLGAAPTRSPGSNGNTDRRDLRP